MKTVQRIKELETFFSGQEGEKCWRHLQEVLPIYGQQGHYKIKPIRSLPNAYEMRIKKGKGSYRLGFFESERDYTLFYVSETLQKVKFDREAYKVAQSFK